MKIGDEYKLSDTGLRQWQKCARELREDPDELVEMLTQMAKQLPDEVNAARNARWTRVSTRPLSRIWPCS
jgi:serine/threonine-protein kinase HipA